MAEVSLTFDDVGFSREVLEQAMSSKDAAAGAAESPPRESIEADAEATDGELAAGRTGETMDGPDGGGQAPASASAADGSTPDDVSPSDVATEAAGMATGSAPSPEHGYTEEAREFLEDKPPMFDFAQFTEVTITRRLFRDGTSHYLINKTPCRLRDVTDFFLGTGVGTKAYSIIEQGRIGMIVSARPQDRRSIIEEAAGITKFKSKKRATERKLEQTRQNLLRVSDIVAELDKRMGALKRQAQKAERYRRYKAEVKDIELWKAAHKYLEMRARHQVLASELGGHRSELGQVRQTFERQDAMAIAERAELAAEERRLSQLQEVLFDLDNRIRLSESKVEFQRREAGAARSARGGGDRRYRRSARASRRGPRCAAGAASGARRSL